MLDMLSDDRPITKRDLEQYTIALIQQQWYISAEEYRRKIGLGKTQFSKLKKLGRFDAGTEQATLGHRKIRIHRCFNMFSQQLELKGDPSKPIKVKLNKRGKHVQKDEKGAGKSSEARSGMHKAERNPQKRAVDAAEQHMHGPQEQPQTGNNTRERS
ncbi:MAG: hypothetical protein FWB90_03910 [Fibromonadales bacterium]|nr:hypothetical protein [Fibromonadales bacterium]